MRIDRFLSNMGHGSRKDVKALIKQRRAAINGEVVNNPDVKLAPERDTVTLDGAVVEYVKYIYVLLNKPAGVVSATFDPEGCVTVSDLAQEATGYVGLIPVGRLDKDATGLIIMTNDGVFVHRATSPKKNVPKVYAVTVGGALTERDITAFKNGVTLDDGYVCLEAKLDIKESGDESRALVTLTEGKFHQVKRMFQALGKQVLTLQRVSFCGVKLPDDLEIGGCRPLTPDELDIIAPFMAEK